MEGLLNDAAGRPEMKKGKANAAVNVTSVAGVALLLLHYRINRGLEEEHGGGGGGTRTGNISLPSSSLLSFFLFSSPSPSRSFASAFYFYSSPRLE